jgi:arylsulfatase A-like enzyme
MISRFNGLRLLGGCLAFLGGLDALHAAEIDHPNIVLVVTDDQGYGDASCYGAADLKTPVMDAVADHGVRFTHFRVNPLCAPTRASMMTGLYSLEAGMWRGPGESERGPPPDDGWPEDSRRIKDGVLLLPQYLQKAGYATGMFGKWHLGYDDANLPNTRGFDQFMGFLAGSHPYWLGRNSRILRNGAPLELEGHTTDVFVDEAIKFIQANKDRPFFCYVPLNAVHGPLRNNERDRNSGKTDWLAYYEQQDVPEPRRDYCAVMSHADQRVGHILDTLRELRLETRTLFIYCSDNGGNTDKYPASNGVLRGGKGQTYEGGIRVPAVIQWPGTIPAGPVTEANAAHFDLFATVLDAAGIEVPKVNGGRTVSGVSLLPHLRSGCQKPLSDRYLFWDLYGNAAALHGDWKLVAELSNHRGDFERAAAEAEKAEFELYDVRHDPQEAHNAAGDQPEIYRDLKSRYLAWLRQSAMPVERDRD